MASKFITNKDGELSLSDRIRSLTQNSKSLDFLVGYFYFSGFNQIYKDIGDKPLRILIGMDTEVDVHNCLREYYTELRDKAAGDSKLTVCTKYYENLKDSINTTDIFDSAESAESYKLFKHKLKTGSLEVRKTLEPNHAKMYLFAIPYEQSSSGTDEGKVIIGSSNFTFQGFRGRNEINVYLQDEDDYKAGKEIFDELWNKAAVLVDASNKDDFEKNVLIHTWLERVPTPYLMYIRTLYEYFKESKDYIKSPQELTRGKLNEYFDVSYQVDAIREGVAKVKRHSGCIIADVVGLGKSIIASAIAANLDKQTIVITPPHLERQWDDYAADFGFRGCRIYTSGKLDKAVQENAGKQDMVIIIDEAHQYRNEKTERYAYLHRLCAGNKVILLSATPFNNRPDDIFSLIKLFQIPAHSTIQTVNNLASQMASLAAEYKKIQDANRKKTIDDTEFSKRSNELAEKIRSLLDPVIIRRTRIDLEKLIKYRKDLTDRGICFSDIEDPVSQIYELGVLSQLYTDTLAKLTGDMNNKGFCGARYKPLTYLKKNGDIVYKSLVDKYKSYFDGEENFTTGQRNMAKFMQQLLVRRFESSKYSFIKTLHNINDSMQKLKQCFLQFKKIPMAKNIHLPDTDEMKTMTDEEINELFPDIDPSQKDKKIWYIDAEDLSPDFLQELDSDIKLLSEFLNEWEKVKEDPKLDKVIGNIKESLQKDPNRKIIVFTEFLDTASYLYKAFESRSIRSMMYSSKSAKGDRETIRNNFDAGLSDNKQENKFDVLIATDAISEGFSLHRAGTIYNYDIPYNPTRVIQRVGRINRINKKVFDKLYIYNFFPSATGEQISHTAEISTFKMKLFQAILGTDTKILTENETVEGYLGKAFIDAKNDEDSGSWDVEFRNELTRIEEKETHLLQEAIGLPYRCRIARQNVTLGSNVNHNIEPELSKDLDKGVLLFSKKGDAYRFCFSGKDGKSELISPQQALELFKSTRDEKGFPISADFYPLYENAKQKSGVVKVSKSNSKTARVAIDLISFLLNNVTDNNTKEYLKAVKEIISLDGMPVYYLQQIAKINPNDKSCIHELKTIVPENYLSVLIEKNNKIGSEPELILLAEELQ